MAILNTRLRLKYDTWDNWIRDNFAENFIPLRGEVCVVEVPKTNLEPEITETGAVDSKANNIEKPAILFKVGDGETSFDKLPWASGLAADVYAWAKKEHAEAADITVADAANNFAGSNVEAVLAEIWTEIQTLTGGESGSVASQIQTGIDQFAATLGTAAYAATTDFDAAGTGAAVLGTIADEAGAATVHGALKSAAAANTNANSRVLTTDFEAFKTSNTTAIENAAKAGTDAAQGVQDNLDNYIESNDAALDVVKTAANSKVASVTASDASITVGGEATTPSVKVNISKDSGNAITLADDGLKVIIPTAAEYEIEKETTAEEGYAATYKLLKDGVQVGASINIPKDMVVSSGSVVELEEGEVEDLNAGTYIKLVLANTNNETLYIPVGSLIEYVTSGSQNGDMVVIAINDNHEVTATITDGTITKAKLEESVQTSLGKADNAVQKIETGTENGTIKVDNTNVAVAGLGTAAYEDATAFAASTILDNLDAELNAADVENASAATDSVNVVTGITQENGKLTAIEATKLAKVASTGSIYDVKEVEKDLNDETEVDCLIFYGGSATELIKNY